MQRFLCVKLLVLALAGCAAEPPGDITDPGHLIYLGFVNREVNCSRCHGPEGTGGMFGPKIHDVMRRKSRSYVRDIILHGKGEEEDGMPGFAQHLTPAQVEQVLDFLATWVDSTTQPARTDSGGVSATP
ncbi:MAG: cytochrome c [candidate division KSB1 bacterium]|nr:cytochrome c [candidate division KSB1 bacterium]MDZ7275561.1 cytochrome c [candidate division KSB1 bacterium]MDZ7286127.1 cytochrome c [candidate division KSB1 bacterium]MDZ7296353.1 cytochrome c [candidate division KSB1 bacterium]MDZ7307129.1 cytochrome c [candidate division KSB1 bacterium]